MSLFNSKVTALAAQLETLKAALATIGFDPVALEKDPQALAAHVSTLAAQEDAAATAGIEKLNTDLAGAKSATSTAQATASLFAATLAAAGVALPADLASLTPENLRAALDATIAAKATVAAAAQVAASGHQALELPATGTPSASTDVAPATAEEFLKIHGEIKDPIKKTNYYRKHASKFKAR